MNSGLIRKTLRELLPTTILVAVGMFLVELLFARILPSFYQEMSESVLRLPFVQKIIPAALGLDPGQAVGPAMLMAIVWIHPVVLALVWTHAIWSGTRIPAGEIDRATIDVLLSMPVSRSEVFFVEAMIALACGAIVILTGLLGNIIGGWHMSTEMVGTVGERMWVCVNLWALYAAVYGMSAVSSSMSDRRGRAAGVVVSLVIAAFVVGFLSAYSPLLKKVLFLSILNYYRPLFVLQDSVRPIADILTLLVIGVVFWLAAAVVFARRDIRTV